MLVKRRLSWLIIALILITVIALDAQAQSPAQAWLTAFYRLRSRLNAQLFRYDEAIADMDAAIALDPDNPALYVERGQRIILLYEWDRVLADYNRALELDPDYADAYYYRGILYASVPEGIDARQLALDDFQRYLDLVPDGQHAADAARYHAEIQAQLGALDAAS
ncbi:MAG: tetratricopeptide repeat protein [Anaerolineae bacterium]